MTDNGSARSIPVIIAVVLMLTVTAMPAAAVLGDTDFAFSTWETRWDSPVRWGKADRSWVWGQVIPGSVTSEPYADAPEGTRAVRYYDKARMEYVPGGVFPNVEQNPWGVTTGLLATELMTGRLQLGDTTFERHQPSHVPVAGDPDSGDLTPSYAVMGTVMDESSLPTGTDIIQTMDAQGSVGADQRFAAHNVTAVDVGSPTGHTVASVFWSWMTQTGVVYNGILDQPWVSEPLFQNPFYATGYPTTEAYWTRARVAGSETDVLVQCFERRCMTYTPSNTPQWQVEMANIGQHYYHWRYIEIPAEAQQP